MKSDPRWGFQRMRRSNPENLGEPVYPWWRAKGYELFIAGTRWGLYPFAAIWHVEPRGADSGTHCKHHDAQFRTRNGWRWHVWHWQIQVHPWQVLRRWVFDRCCECGLKFPWGYSPVGFCWDPKRPPWWKFWVAHSDIYHDRCASLRGVKGDSSTDREIIRALVQEIGLRSGESDEECLRRLYRAWEFRPAYRLMGLLGFEWNEERTEMVKRQ